MTKTTPKRLATSTLFWLTLFFSLVIGAPAGRAQEAPKLGPGDEVMILIPEGAELEEHRVVLDTSGEVGQGVYGRVQIKGQTIAQARDSISKALSTMLADTSGVHVTIVSRGALVMVTGHVAKPGVVRLELGASAWTAIQGAGGPNPGADLTRVERIHEGNRQVIDVRAYLTRGEGADVAMAPGDTLFVPADVTMPAAHASTAALLDARALDGKIVVLGEVGEPGIFTHGEGMTFLQALALAKGASPNGDLEYCYAIQRQGATRVDLSRELRGEVGASVMPKVEGGLILYVPLLDLKRPITHRPVAHVMGEVARPGEVLVDEQGKPLVVVLSQTGGPTSKANPKRVRVVRQQGGMTIASTYDLERYGRRGGFVGQARVYPGDVVMVETRDQDRVKRIARTISDVAIIATTFALLLAL